MALPRVTRGPKPLDEKMHLNRRALRRRAPNGVCWRPKRCVVPVEDPRRYPDPSDLNGGLARSHSLPRTAIPPEMSVSRSR